jgi:hypothetical protein
MIDEEAKQYILTRTLPNPLDVEKAKRMLLEHVYLISQAHNNAKLLSGYDLVDHVERQNHEFANPTGIQPGYENLEKELTSVRAALAAREALSVLQAHGVLVAFGQPSTTGGATSNEEQKREVKVPWGNENFDRYPIPLPAIYLAYRFASQFREDQFYRLASGNVYLSYLGQGKLPPRTKRCIQECVDAYRHGLYLSAVMAIGAASESLWMKLGQLLVAKKPTVTTALAKPLSAHAPSILRVIEDTWNLLGSQCGTELDQVFSPVERKPFIDRAKQLCERRNYAMHSDKADTEEASFSYIETGELLLGSINYFNQLSKLIEVIEALP